MYNPVKQKEFSSKYYNKDVDKARRMRVDSFQKTTERNRQWLCEYLLEHPCVDCGYDNIIALEFDHITDDKADNMSFLISNGCSMKRVLAEIAKCEVVCSNCHKIRTATRANYYKVRFLKERSLV